jgi:hypothetical protein
MKARSCAQVLETLMHAGETGRMPWVLLRPRAFDDTTVFEGDFDFLADSRRFEDILATVFQVCQDAGISVIVRQHSAFKRQIELLDAEARRVTLELWPHAEFRLRASHGLLTRAALDYTAYEATPANERPSLLAALFILHLHHKQKDLRSDLVRARFDHFLGLPQLAPALRDTLVALRDGTMDLRQSHAMALDYLQSRHIPLKSPWQLVADRAGWTLRNLLKWPAPRTSALVGPDGSGKTALMDAVRHSTAGKRLRYRKFKRVFRRPLFHLRKSEPRNVRDEKVLWLVLPVAWLCFSASRWLTGWARPVLYDRYFYDYFVRDVRDPGRTLRRIGAYDLCTALAPRPQRLVVASCPADVIHQRKTEMTQASIERLYQVYIDQVVRAGIPDTLFCHTGVALHTSGRQVAAFLNEPAAD